MNDNRAIYGLRSKDHELLYEGRHNSFKEALEYAFNQKIDLTGLDARHQDLSHITLDGITLTGADFTDANLTGANMSEALFTNCVFDNAQLFDVCFCYSDFKSCVFLYSGFGMTDFSEANLSQCRFEGNSALSLNFTTMNIMKDNHFRGGNLRQKVTGLILAWVDNKFSNSTIC